MYSNKSSSQKERNQFLEWNCEPDTHIIYAEISI